MLVVRFQRVGKKHQPSYRIVVAERRSKLGGPPNEYVGNYDPFTKKGVVNKERALYWLGVGAQPTIRVHNLFVSLGVISGPKIPVSISIRKNKKTDVADALPVSVAGAVGVAKESAESVPAAIVPDEKSSKEGNVQDVGGSTEKEPGKPAKEPENPIGESESKVDEAS